MFGGLRVIYTTDAVKDTDQRLFPVSSKHRSRRTHKKLVMRFGGEFVKEPCMYAIDGMIFAHPALEARILRASCADMTGVIV